MALTLIPYGSGERQKSWQIPDDGKVICRYKFFYILAHDCQLVSNVRWYVSDKDGEREITYEQLRQIIPHQTPHLGLWEQYALAIIGLVLVAGVFFTSTGAEFIDWGSSTIWGILIITLLYFGGNYIFSKFK